MLSDYVSQKTLPLSKTNHTALIVTKLFVGMNSFQYSLFYGKKAFVEIVELAFPLYIQ